MPTTVMFDGAPVEFDNRTPHELRIYNMDKTEVVAVVPSSGTVRVSETLDVVSDYKDEVPLVEIIRDPNKLEGLPHQVPGRYIIVSDLVYQAAMPLRRTDILRPGPAVRDSEGRIIGYQGVSL